MAVCRDDAARNRRTRAAERLDADIGRLGLLAILAPLVFAAAPAFRPLPGSGPAAGCSADRGSAGPVEAAASIGGDTILGQTTRKSDRTPGAPAAGTIETAGSPLLARMAIRSDPAVLPVADGGHRRPYDPRPPGRPTVSGPAPGLSLLRPTLCRPAGALGAFSSSPLPRRRLKDRPHAGPLVDARPRRPGKTGLNPSQFAGSSEEHLALRQAQDKVIEALRSTARR